jgi:UDP-N-acetylglucosamine--N-acetylmuramyl-(pentapeptide) pyrophosphoryl-undecaprenol N-acetylglucosamine transferase
MNHLVIMAAGTGGHVIPGLAVAHEMRSRGWSVSWLGTRTGMENRLVPPTGIALDTIGFSGLRGKGPLHTLTGGLRLLGAFWSCLKILRARGASAVLGMGGYVCFPGGMMAALLGRPLLLVNADAALLLSNRALLPVADKVAFGFDGAAVVKTKRAVVTGNPVRESIESLPAPTARYAERNGVLRLLVVGGSLGASRLNAVVPFAIRQSGLTLQVRHQAGARGIDAALAAYAQAGVKADVSPFIDDMAAAYAEADLVICRSGALTVSELAAVGVGAVLVPFPAAVDDHQTFNAQFLVREGAAVLIADRDLTPERLAQELKDLCAGRGKLLAMAERARLVAKPRAAADLAAACLEQLEAA